MSGWSGGHMKRRLGRTNVLFPLPTILVGATVSGRPNYMTVAWDGIIDFDLVSISITRDRHTYAGIRENGTFSVNVPWVGMLDLADHCGLVSGKEEDKSSLFTNFYGVLKTAPMIEECPLNMECSVEKVVPTGRSHDVIFGKIAESYCDESLLKGKTPDYASLDPILYVMGDGTYRRMGEVVGKIGFSKKSAGKGGRE